MLFSIFNYLWSTARTLIRETFLAGVDCCPILDHLMILVGILAFRLSNSRVCI